MEYLGMALKAAVISRSFGELLANEKMKRKRKMHCMITSTIWKKKQQLKMAKTFSHRHSYSLLYTFYTVSTGIKME